MKLPNLIAFEWDKGNLEKNWVKHKVHFREAEEIFLNKGLRVFPDPEHSQKEERFVAFGVTNQARKLSVFFTIRGENIRVVSVRDQVKEKKESMKKSKLKSIPRFKNEDEERDFWATHDATDYFDMDNPIELDLSRLKPTTETISLRLPGFLLMRIKQIANSRDVPYQSLMKIFLAERVEKELKSKFT